MPLQFALVPQQEMRPDPDCFAIAALVFLLRPKDQANWDELKRLDDLQVQGKVDQIQLL
jgi:hypothetical protein